MSKPNTVLLVLTLSLVSRVTSEPPTPLADLGDLCQRKEFIDKGTLSNYLQQLKPDTDIQSLLNILGKSVTHAIQICSKKFPPFDDIEITSGKTYICGSEGTINNLYSLVPKNWAYLEKNAQKKAANEPLVFKMSFEYQGGINVEYYQPYIHQPMTHDVKGSLFIEFEEFIIDFTVSTESVTKTVEKLQNKQCFLYIHNFEASLHQPSYSMLYVDHKRSYELSRGKINNLILDNIEKIKDVLINKVKAGFYEGLVNSGEWVCLDDHVKEVIDKKLTSTRQTISSEEFKKYCNNINYIRPKLYREWN